MRLPRKIVLAGHDVYIVHKKRIFVNKTPCYGVWNVGKSTIYICTGLTPTRKKEIFLHELLHAIEYIYRIKISEESISNMSRALLHALRTYKIDLLS